MKEVNVVEVYDELIGFKSAIMLNIRKKIDWNKDLYIVVNRENSVIEYVYEKDYDSTKHIILTKIESLKKLLYDSMKILIKHQNYLKSTPTKDDKTLWDMIKM